MNQIALPTDLRPEESEREKSLGGAIGLCLKAAGHEPKEAMAEICVDGRPLDKAQWSRWESGGEGVIWPKFNALMDFCGNDAPVLWMLSRRGYDLHSVRRKQSAMERELSAAKDALDQERMKNKVLLEALTGRAVA